MYPAWKTLLQIQINVRNDEICNNGIYGILISTLDVSGDLICDNNLSWLLN